MFGLIVATLCISLALFYALISRPERVALNPEKFQKYALIKRTEVSHDTFIFRFELLHKNQKLGLPVGQHIALRAVCPDPETGKSSPVVHSYTPISSDEDRGYVDFMIKVYFANVNPRFIHGGRLSQQMHRLKIGEEIEMRGPQGRFEYLGQGKFKIKSNKGTFNTSQVDAFAMVGGGTGITPLLQIIRAIFRSPEDKTQIYLVYANQTEKDILLRKELDELVEEHPKQIHVWYTIDRDVSPDWKYSVGHVDEEMLREHLLVKDKLPSGIQRVMGLMCGPPPMLTFAVKPNLTKLGYSDEEMFAF